MPTRTALPRRRVHVPIMIVFMVICMYGYMYVCVHGCMVVCMDTYSC